MTCFKSFVKGVLLLTFFIQINNIFIQVNDREKRCVIQRYNETQTIYFTYTVYGYFRDMYNIEILYNGTDRVWESRNRDSGVARLSARKTGNYFVCVIPRKIRRDFRVNINFMEDNPATSMSEVTIDSIENLGNYISRMSKTINKIDTNIKAGAGNRDSYSKIADDVKGSITLFTSLKVIFLLIFSVFQLLMITSVLKQVKVTKKIETGKKKVFGKDASETTEFL